MRSRRHNGDEEAMRLAKLAEVTGTPARTIRFYIARRLLPPPLKAGRGAVYGAEHVRRIAEIRAAQARGLTLAEIARNQVGGDGEGQLSESSAWWHYEVAPDVVVQVRAGASPWRLKRIRNALAELRARLHSQPEEER
ncbi:MAG: MerR family transcriptional regulator [Verrucomicrobiales bacterium]|nr:MerR family transcriptional regulator [Verrucomicrobiales bacterium]